MANHTQRETKSGYATFGQSPHGSMHAGLHFDSSDNPSILDRSGNVAAQWSDGIGSAGWLKETAVEVAIPFVRTKTITSAAAATAVPVVQDTEVPAGYVAFVTDIIGRVNGTTVWATTATVKLQDTNGTPVDFVTFAVAGMTSQARLYKSSANVTVENAMSLGTGGTASKGLQLKGDANGTGSDFVVTVVGFYRKSA